MADMKDMKMRIWRNLLEHLEYNLRYEEDLEDLYGREMTEAEYERFERVSAEIAEQISRKIR